MDIVIAMFIMLGTVTGLILGALLAFLLLDVVVLKVLNKPFREHSLVLRFLASLYDI